MWQFCFVKKIGYEDSKDILIQEGGRAARHPSPGSPNPSWGEGGSFNNDFQKKLETGGMLHTLFFKPQQKIECEFMYQICVAASHYTEFRSFLPQQEPYFLPPSGTGESNGGVAVHPRSMPRDRAPHAGGGAVADVEKQNQVKRGRKSDTQ